MTTHIALALHQDQIDRYGGDTGVRDVGLLESALAMPRATFSGQFVHEDLPAMAGAYLFHLAKNHAFVDGNKRVAFAVTLYFLDDHGYTLDFNHDEAEQFVLRIAASELTKDQATALLREHLVAG
ncbi:MAG: type II toxin-antitoxin system death-on-curing family toxin [Phycisphaerales bacterium JB063]